MANKSAKQKAAPKVNREELVAKARFDYGILNAEDISTDQLQADIAAIDKQADDARVADAKARKEAQKNA